MFNVQNEIDKLYKQHGTDLGIDFDPPQATQSFIASVQDCLITNDELKAILSEAEKPLVSSEEIVFHYTEKTKSELKNN